MKRASIKVKSVALGEGNAASTGGACTTISTEALSRNSIELAAGLGSPPPGWAMVGLALSAIATGIGLPCSQAMASVAEPTMVEQTAEVLTTAQAGISEAPVLLNSPWEPPSQLPTVERSLLAVGETLPLTTVNFQVRQDEFFGAHSAIDPTFTSAIDSPIAANASTGMAQNSAPFPHTPIKPRSQTLGDEGKQRLASLENHAKTPRRPLPGPSQIKWAQFERQQVRFERMLAQLRSQSTERLSLLPTQDLSQLSTLIAKAEESLLATANLTIPVAGLAAAPAKRFTTLAAIPLPSRLPKSVFYALHRVKAGETLDAIAQRYQLSQQDLMQVNQLESQTLLPVGQELKIPLVNPSAESSPMLDAHRSQGGSKLQGPSVPSLIQAGTIQSEQTSKDPYVEQLKADVEKLRQEYQVQYENNPVVNSQPLPIASATVPAESLPPESLAIAPVEAETYDRGFRSPVGETVSPELPPLSSPDPYLPNPETFDGYIWPAKGVITSGYGWRWGRMHRGIDIAAPVGTPIVAASSGEVVVAGWNSGGFGNLVKVRHYDGSLTLYAHNSRILVRKGQRVKQGQQIAEMGSTGRSTGPHLHFEVHPNGRGAVNPIAYLPKKR